MTAAPNTFKIKLDKWTGAGGNTLVQGLNVHRPSGTQIGHQADDVAGQVEQDVIFRQFMTNGKIATATVKRAGHGSSVGCESLGANRVRMWLGHDQHRCSGYVEFNIGQTGTLTFVKNYLPKGDIEIDQENNILVLRNNDSRGKRDRYRVYEFDTVKKNDGRNRVKIADFYISHWGKRWQGMFVCEGRLFVHRDVATKGASSARMFDLNGKHLQTWDTERMGDEAEGFYSIQVSKTEVVYVIKRTGPSGSKRIIEGTKIITLPKLNTPEKPEPWDGKSFPGVDAFVVGQTHPAVTVLGKRLVAHGWKGYNSGPGHRFTDTDKAAVKWFQEQQGWSGSGADGYPGPKTWDALMDEPKKPEPKPEEPEVPKLPANYPPANRTAQWYPSIAGGATFTKVDKLIIHTTEGSSWFDYGSVGYGPHLTLKGVDWRQHIPLTKSATALSDPSSTPVRENRDNCIQIEVVGFAKDAENWSDEQCAEIARLIAWLHQYGLPLVIKEEWTGPNTTARMNSAQYDAFKGVLGHQHVSGNDHWDPGKIPWLKIITMAKGIVAGQAAKPPTVAEPPAEDQWDGLEFPGASAFRKGSTHPAVTELGVLLEKHGWKGYRVGPGIPMGDADIFGTRWFQGLQGWDGDDADGIPGAETWKRLQAPKVPRPSPPAGGEPINGRITTGFKVPGSWAWGKHPGEDWNGPDPDYGDPVFAVRTGIVKYIGRLPWDQKSGNAFGDRALVIQDLNGTTQTLYAHMSACNVRVGQVVQVGDQVGKIGFSGNVIPPTKQGSHLHVERRRSPYRYGTDVVAPVYGD